MLEDQYNALIKAGMPEHPKLRYVAESDEGGVYWHWLYDGEHEHFDEDIARDLITMHALRWWRRRDGWLGSASVADDGSAGVVAYRRDCLGRLTATGTDIIDAIVQALTNDSALDASTIS